MMNIYNSGEFAVGFLQTQHMIWLFFGCSILCFLVSFASYVVIEVPFGNMAKDFLSVCASQGRAKRPTKATPPDQEESPEHGTPNAEPHSTTTPPSASAPAGEPATEESITVHEKNPLGQKPATVMC